MKYFVEDYMNPSKEENILVNDVISKWWNETSEIGFSPISIVEIAYMMLVKQDGNESSDELYKEVLANIPSYILNRKDFQNVIKKGCDECDQSVLKCIIANGENYTYAYPDYSTPLSIIRLAYNLLKIRDTDSVMDLCCGMGSFLKYVYKNNNTCELNGVELNPEPLLYSKIISKTLGFNINYSLNNAFNMATKAKKYNKVFINYPFRMRIKDLGDGYHYMNELENKIPSISRATSSDWVFNSLALDVLDDKGIAVCIMSNGSTSNTLDKSIRKFYIESGYIKAVISLPGRLFENTNIPTTAIVFEKKKCDEILFIDASEVYQKGRRINVLSETDVEKIISCFEKETDFCKKVPIAEVVEQDYNLTPARYLSSYISMSSIKDGKEFGSVIKNITRGASIRAEELDKLSSPEETDYQYLMLSNIQDGTIQDNLPYINKIDDSLKKYCIKEDDLIMSKNGYPYKVAVVGKLDKEVLANGNLFIIELDKEQANPSYIKALFESETGIALLKSITVGATIPNFGSSQLKSLIIPLPSLDEQNKIADEFYKIDDEISVLKLRIKKIQERKNGLFEELSRGD